MRNSLIADAAMLAVSTPSFAENSAAETIVRETSTVDISTARIRLALGNMSAVEREAFFSADSVERQRILEDIVIFDDSNSAAEMATAVSAAAGN